MKHIKSEVSFTLGLSIFIISMFLADKYDLVIVTGLLGGLMMKSSNIYKEKLK
ncbi:MAG: hypothetical protein ACOWWH_05925 [Eubacteriaceae bacterium]